MYNLYKIHDGPGGEQRGDVLIQSKAPEELFWYLKGVGQGIELKELCAFCEELTHGFLGIVEVNGYLLMREGKGGLLS